jgi:hypothetical protein
MMHLQPPNVINKFLAAMKQHAPAMSFDQVCSLWRHHIKRLHPNKSMTELGLGATQDINESARMVLDCCVDDAPVKLERVRNHKRKWCASPRGNLAVVLLLRKAFS